MMDSNFPHGIADDIIEGSATNHGACGSVWTLQKHQEDIAAHVTQRGCEISTTHPSILGEQEKCKPVP